MTFALPGNVIIANQSCCIANLLLNFNQMRIVLILHPLHIPNRRLRVKKHSLTTICSGKMALLMGIALALGGCASPGESPDAELQSAESAIKQATAADARQYEPILLNNAQNKVADAKGLIAKEEYKSAGRLLEQASVDAQLAGARADTAKARQAVEEVNRNIEALRQRINQSQ